VQASDVVIAHLTLTRSYDELVRVDSTGGDLTGVQLYDLHLLDPGSGAVTIGPDPGNPSWADDGEVACSQIELTPTGRDEIRGLCDTWGIDAHGARGWTVRDNQIAGLWCDTGLGKAGIRFWRGSRDTVITRNLLGDVQRGIVLGETQDQVGRTYGDAPCGGGVVQHIDGTVTNNIVFANTPDLVASTGGFEIGVLAGSSCNAQILHNTVYSEVQPNTDASILHRFATTSGTMANNLTSHTLVREEGSTLDNISNLENMPVDTWFFPAQGDFHLSPAALTAIDGGDPAYTVPDDIDGETRDATPDVGADEFSN
jgi:hypothetical protein